MTVYKLSHNSSQAAANINRACREESTCDQTVRCWFLKFRSEDMSLEYQGKKGRPSAIDRQNLKALFTQNLRLTAREIYQVVVAYRTIKI